MGIIPDLQMKSLGLGSETSPLLSPLSDSDACLSLGITRLKDLILIKPAPCQFLPGHLIA